MKRVWTASAAAVSAAFLAAALPAAAQNMLAPAQDNPPTTAPRSSNDPGYILKQVPDRLPETSNQCVFFRTLYDWKPLNNYNLIVWAPSRNDPYHIQLDRACLGLRFAHSIGFNSHDSRLCGFGGDSVIVESGGGLPQHCPIGSITKLTEDALKSLLAQAPGQPRGGANAAGSTPNQ